MTIRPTSTVAILCFSLGACVQTMASGGFTVNQAVTLHAFENVKRRASFEMGCPSEQLTVVVLEARGRGYAPEPDQIGVSGCSRKAVYVSTRAGWVMNTQTNLKR
jgi:hypothetical protein